MPPKRPTPVPSSSPQPNTLTEPLVRRIKSRLWYGETAQTIAEALSTPTLTISIDTIRGIAAGVRWKHVPWPVLDASGHDLTGGLPSWRRAQINAARQQLLRDGSAALRRLLDASQPQHKS